MLIELMATDEDQECALHAYKVTSICVVSPSGCEIKRWHDQFL